MGVLEDIGVNLAANVIFWLGLGALVGLYVRVSQRRFRKFFGISRGSSLRVVLSNLWMPSAGSRPIGYTVSLHELRGSQLIDSIFSSSSQLPDLVKGLVDSLFLRNTDFSHQADVGPPLEGDVDGFLNNPGTLIVVGGGARNLVRARYIKEGLLTARLYDEPDSKGLRSAFIRVEKGDRAGDVIRPARGHKVALIERAYDSTRDRVVIFCAGYGADATWAACHYLAEHWRSLTKEFKGQQFTIGIAFDMKEYEFHYKSAKRILAVSA